MSDLIAELEGVVKQMGFDLPQCYARDQAYEFLRTHHAEIAAAVRDAKRWRYVVENSEWIRDEEDTLMAFRFEDDRPNLESVGMRTDAIDSAMRAGEGEG
jgi:hypothetical protein